MTIEMYCDRCGGHVDGSTLGGVRLRTGKKELSLHLCAEHQHELRKMVKDFAEKGIVREVSPSLKNDER